MRIVYRILIGKPEGKRPFGRRRHRWKDNVKMDLREIGWEGVDWIHLAQDRYQWRTVMNTVKDGEFIYQLTFSRSDLLHVVSYEGRLKSSWTHLITPSRNFVEVR
jgi:hypothetical protein